MARSTGYGNMQPVVQMHIHAKRKPDRPWL